MKPLLVLLLIGLETMAQNSPSWLAKPLPLATPKENVSRASSAEQILNEGENLEPGHTLLIEPGHYKLPRPLVLRGRTNITLRSSTGFPADVTLTGKGWKDGDEHDDIFHISNCDGVTIAGLTFAECRSYGVKVEAEHAPRNIHLYNCRFRNIGIRALKGSAGKDPAVRAVRGSVQFCDFANDKIPPANWLFGGDYISAIDMMALEDWTFSDNVFRNINGRNGGARAAIFIWVRSTNVVVERNIIVNCDRGIAFGNPGESTANEPGAKLAYVSDGIIRNNFIAGGGDCGLELWHVDGIKVWHNTIWRPERNWGRGIRLGKGTVRSQIINNLIHGGIQMEGGEADIHHNVTDRLENYFVDPRSGNLVLTDKAVEAIHKATPLNTVPTDLRGSLRKGPPDIGAWEYAGASGTWMKPMREVHARFKGQSGTLAQLGDSITYSGAYWSPLAGEPKNMTPLARCAYSLVSHHLRSDNFNQKGPRFGNQGSMTIRWAKTNVTNWLQTLNPEAAVIMFGSNDYRQMNVAEYERTVREVVEACLTNGTVVLLTTPPPQSARLSESLSFAAAIRQLAANLQVPLIDYSAQIFARRPNDWDGSIDKFQNFPGDGYQVPTLISRDGVHPSNPRDFVNDFSTKALTQNGYTLRNYLTLLSYAQLLQEVLVQ